MIQKALEEFGCALEINPDDSRTRSAYRRIKNKIAVTDSRHSATPRNLRHPQISWLWRNGEFFGFAVRCRQIGLHRSVFVARIVVVANLVALATGQDKFASPCPKSSETGIGLIRSQESTANEYRHRCNDGRLWVSSLAPAGRPYRTDTLPTRPRESIALETRF